MLTPFVIVTISLSSAYIPYLRKTTEVIWPGGRDEMPKVETDVTTDVDPAAVRAALVDFSPGRPERWPGISPDLYEVYEVGETSALVKEGTKNPGMTVWAKERYDWSDPQTVRWTVQESNFCAPGSYVAATITSREGGGSRVHIEWNRTPTSFGGRVATLLIRLSKGKPVAASFRQGMSRLEAGTGSK
jgi:hypothetical protein